VKGTTSADTKGREEGGGRRCSRHWTRESSLVARDEDHGKAGCPPAAHGGPQWSSYPPAAQGRDPMPEQVEDPRWSSLFLKDCIP